MGGGRTRGRSSRGLKNRLGKKRKKKGVTFGRGAKTKDASGALQIRDGTFGGIVQDGHKMVYRSSTTNREISKEVITEQR
jgi:hypothetical protein